MIIEKPLYLLLLILLPLSLLIKYKLIKINSLQLPSISTYLKTNPKSSKIILAPWYLLLISLTLLIFALSKPYYLKKKLTQTQNKIEIILAIDSSISMWFLDDENNKMQAIGYSYLNGVKVKIYENPKLKLKQRITIAKEVLTNFILDRKEDKIGIITFKAQGITLSPPISQKRYLIDLINKLNLNMIYQDGTSIGSALGTSINAFKYSNSQNKIIILITDGNDNQEQLNQNVITQIQAAKISAYKKIKIYTIGIGGKGRVFAPYNFLSNPRQIYDDYTNSKYFIEYGREQIREENLKMISKISKGKFYKANNKQDLENIYKDINKIEKGKIKNNYSLVKQDLEYYLLLFSIITIFISGLLKNTILKTFP